MTENFKYYTDKEGIGHSAGYTFREKETLAVPVGLYIESTELSGGRKPHKTKMMGVIDSKIFDYLFDCGCTIKNKSDKTKKHVKKNNNKTKKHKR